MMSRGETMTLARIAEWTGGQIEGDPSMEVRRPMPLESAGPHDVALLADERYLQKARRSGAGAFLVSRFLLEDFDDDRPRVVVEDARAALLPLLEGLDPTPWPAPGVHPTAVLGQGVELEEGVSIGPYAVLGAGVHLGRGTVIGAHCVLGERSRTGPHCYLHPHVVLYAEVELGAGVILHSGARIGVDGFGYVIRDGRYVKQPQVGACVLGDDVEVGANACIDRGSIGDTELRRGVKVDNLVHLAHNVRVGEDTVMAALTGVAGSTTIGRACVFGGQVGVGGHMTIGDRVHAAGQAGIIGNLSDGEVVMGFPARSRTSQLRALAATRKLPEALKRLRELEEEVERLRRGLEGDDG
jgi:UDP-3-O-[3-hydroxymyristoyl] glucosamine N-acyltransferase